MVAATILTFVFCGLEEPTFINSPFSNTRNKRTCVVSGNSPTSSKKIVPPSATSKYPFRSCIAPVKEPFSCPKSSLSIVPSGIAPQFTAIYLACFLCDNECIILGIFSLPTPLSPVTKTEISVGATLMAFSKARFKCVSLPIIPKRCFNACKFSIFL